MPVSRKRKKKGKAVAPRMPRDHAAGILEGFAAHRRFLDARRQTRASTAAEALMPELAALVAGRSVADLEDAICQRLGVVMASLESVESIEDSVGPNTFAEVLVAHAAETVHDNSDVDAWRVLTAIARILPFPLNEQASVTIAELQSAPGGSRLPAPPSPVSVNGPVLWARDAYGGRFGITAMFSAPDRPDRWYLWDVDTCGLAPFTVYSGYFPDAGAALAQWRAGVGDVAATDADFAPVDDIGLLSELLPAEEGFMRLGGEDALQMAEYHRGKRLADEVRKAAGHPDGAASGDRLDPTRARELFTTWLAEHRPSAPANAPDPELIEELADYWKDDPIALYHTCSPHRVANAVEGIRGYYQPEAADELIALLPDWTAWLSEYNGTPAHLAERAIRWARDTTGHGDGAANPLARVTE